MGTGPMALSVAPWRCAACGMASASAKIIGLIPTLGSLALAIGYAVVLGWACHYLFSAMTGELMAQTDTGAFFGAMASDFGNVGFHLLGLAITFGIMILGVSRGIEKANKVLMPTFFVLFVIIAIRVATLPRCGAGYEYLARAPLGGVAEPHYLGVRSGPGILQPIACRVRHTRLR